MKINQRKVTLHTSDKVYKGSIDIANETLRTIDVFNSANVFWKDPNERSFEDALLLNNAAVVLEGNTKLGEFKKLQIKLSDIIFFHDSLEIQGDGIEKKRAGHLKAKTKESASTAHLITRSLGAGFFYITGSFFGLFKSKSNYRFIPITQANVAQVLWNGEKWQKKAVPVEGGFVGISTSHIESCTFSEKKV